MCVCRYLRISYTTYMCVCVHLRICTQTSHVSVYILSYKHAVSTHVTYTYTKSTRVGVCLRIHVQVYTYVYGFRIWTQSLDVYGKMFTSTSAEYVGVYIHFNIYTQRVTVCGYIVTYIHTGFTCVLL